MADPSQLPTIAILSPEEAERQAEQTRNGLYRLLPSEIAWRDRQYFLKDHGYELRKRYSPDWTPSWLGTNIHPHFCEDSIFLTDPMVIDATRSEDRCAVAIKCLPNQGHELNIALFLTSIRQPENHCVPVLDNFKDPLDCQRTLLVMPYLRPFNDPEFVMVGDAVDFVGQMLEGLSFLHSHHIAHRDIAPPNVMMDGSALYPNGHHPVRMNYSVDSTRQIAPLNRLDHPVRYYYIDFGLSVRFTAGTSPLSVGDVGRDDEVPELSTTVPYDAYKADIYALGNLFDKELEQRYHYLHFLRDLIDSMKQRQPELRPSACDLVASFQQTRSQFSSFSHRWRLSLKSGPGYERILKDTVTVAWEGFHQLKQFVR